MSSVLSDSEPTGIHLLLAKEWTQL